MDYYCSSATQSDATDVLELCLKDILSLIKPSEHDRAKRLNTISELTTSIRSLESLKGAVVQPFGSFVSNLYTKWADLDISVELSSTSRISTSRKQKQNLLKDILRILRRKGVTYKWQFILNARVPLLIYESSYYNISCDVSIDNYRGQIKSKILLWITNIDERFRDMVLLIKEWAKNQNINDPKSGTLNSYSLCLLIIFHFQTCVPAILPPLKEIYGGNTADDLTGTGFITERHIEDVCAASITRFKSQSNTRRNQSSLSQLLKSFFDKFSIIEAMAREYAICTYTGRWERISSNPKWLEKSHCLLIEDPFEQPDNAARAVGLRGLSVISNAFRTAYSKLSSGFVLLDRDALLSFLARPVICSQLRLRPQGHPRIEYSGYAVLEPIQDQCEYSGYAVLEPIQHQLRNMLRLDKNLPSSSTVTSQRPVSVIQDQCEYSGYAVLEPIQHQLRNMLRLDKNLPSSSTVTSQRPVSVIQDQCEYSGYAVLEPIQDQFHNVLRSDRNLPSSSTVTQRPVGVSRPSQKMWRPKSLNR